MLWIPTCRTIDVTWLPYKRPATSDGRLHSYLKRTTCTGVVVTKAPFANFVIEYFPKYLLDSLFNVHLWQVSRQLSWDNTCQIWTWYSVANICLTMLKIWENNGKETIGSQVTWLNSNRVMHSFVWFTSYPFYRACVAEVSDDFHYQTSTFKWIPYDCITCIKNYITLYLVSTLKHGTACKNLQELYDSPNMCLRFVQSHTTADPQYTHTQLSP